MRNKTIARVAARWFGKLAMRNVVKVPTHSRYRVILFAGGRLGYLAAKPGSGAALDETNPLTFAGYENYEPVDTQPDAREAKYRGLVALGLTEIVYRTWPEVAKNKYKTIEQVKAMYPQYADQDTVPYYKPVLFPWDSLVVDVKRRVVDLDTSWQETMTRRPGLPTKSKPRTYVIPSGDVGFASRQGDLIKVLKHLVGGADKRVEADFRIVGSERYRGQTVGDVIGQERDMDVALGRSVVVDTKEPVLVAYHGTSVMRWNMIKKQGLKPGATGEVYVDLVKGYSEYNVYLAFEPNVAENYATRQAIKDASGAIVLKVLIRDTNRIIADEDAMWPVKLSRPYLLTVANPGDSDAEIGDIEEVSHASYKDLLASKRRGDFVENAEFAAFYAEVVRLTFKDLKRSLGRGTFAYKGRVPATDVKPFMEYKRKAYPPEDKLDFDTYQRTRKEVQDSAKRFGGVWQ